MADSATPWTVTYQAPQSMQFSRQEYWSGLPFLSPGDLPGPGIEPGSPTLQADALLSEPPGKQSLKHWTTREVPINKQEHFNGGGVRAVDDPRAPRKHHLLLVSITSPQLLMAKGLVAFSRELI